MATTNRPNTTPTSKWQKVAALGALVAAVAGFLGNVDKIGKFVKDWFVPRKPEAASTVVVQITVETLVEAAARAAAAASTTSGAARSEALQSAAALEKVAKDPRAIVAPAEAATAPTWLKVAFIELGQTEMPGKLDNPRILEYLRSVSLPAAMLHDETPWTSAFANWALSQARIEGTGSANPKAWLDWGKQIEQPRLGALVLLKRGGNPVGPVCFFLSETTENVVCLGGNFSNSVAITAFPKEAIHSYRWPK